MVGGLPHHKELYQLIRLRTSGLDEGVDIVAPFFSDLSPTFLRIQWEYWEAEGQLPGEPSATVCQCCHEWPQSSLGRRTKGESSVAVTPSALGSLWALLALLLLLPLLPWDFFGEFLYNGLHAGAVSFLSNLFHFLHRFLSSMYTIQQDTTHGCFVEAFSKVEVTVHHSEIAEAAHHNYSLTFAKCSFCTNW